jgi:plastocyanin
LVLGPVTAHAYETVELTEGGKVTGVVTLAGDPPKSKRATFPKDLDPKDAKLCNGKRPLIRPFYSTGENDGLANVVVWIDGIERGKAKKKELGYMINEDCLFDPHVQTLDVGAKVQIENQDPILHTTHAISQGQRITMFNVGMPRKGQVAQKKVRRPGILKIQCDSGHTWMRAWIHAFMHPYHTVTDADGKFEIADVPPGTYTLNFWHENSGTQSKTITVAPNGAVTEGVTFEVQPLPEGHEHGHAHQHG